MKALLMAVAAGLGTAGAAAAWACGACIEDKIAATYDHAVIERAIASHGQVVFVAIDGSVNATAVIAQVVARAPRVRGLQPGSLRTSTSPAAFSFVLDSSRDARAAISSFRRGVSAKEAQLIAIRTIRDGPPHEPD